MYLIQTCMYMFIHVCTCFELYQHVHTVYKPVYGLFLQIMFRVQMSTYISCNVHTLLNWVCTLIHPFACCFLVRPAGWPVGWDWLLPCIKLMIKHGKFKHTSLIAIRLCRQLFSHPLPSPPCRLRSGWGPQEAPPRRLRFPPPPRLAGWQGWRGWWVRSVDTRERRERAPRRIFRATTRGSWWGPLNRRGR